MSKSNNTETVVSPYNFAKIASERLGRKVVPQQIYALVRKGTIPSTKNEVGHLQMTVQDGETWIQGQLAKLEEKVA